MKRFADLVAALLLALFCGQLVLISYTGPYGWDDGAITLAYGRTLAEHGRFALTSVSEVVEGSSSPLFVLLAALFSSLVSSGFDQLIAFSQSMALAGAALTAVLLWQNLARHITDNTLTLLVTAGTVLLPTFSSEIANGMEMTVFAALLLAFVQAMQQRSSLVYLWIVLLLLTRFEAVFYLLFALVMSTLVAREQRADTSRLIAAVVATFAAITFARYLYFGDMLPNTLYAKLHPPYTPADLVGKVRLKLAGLGEFLSVHGLLLLALLPFVIGRTQLRQRLADIKFNLVLGFLVFALITGKNWGYDGRMTLACTPLLVLLLAQLWSSVHDIGLQANGSRLLQWQGNGSLVWWLPVLLAAVFVANAPLAFANIKTALIGGYYQQKPLPSLLLPRMQRSLQHNTSFGISPHNYRVTGQAVERLRTALGLATISFLSPDVGGLALCCDNIQVLDSALLANRQLAKTGYDRFADYLEQSAPDIIETHEVWSEVTGIYQLDYFRQHYLPLVLDGNLLWLERRHLGSLNAVQVHASAAAITDNTRYYTRGTPDERYLQTVYAGPLYEWNSRTPL